MLRFTRLTFLFILLINSLTGMCQSGDSIRKIELQPVIVTSYIEKPARQTSLNLSVIRIDSLNRLGTYNLTDLMAKTPGINMLSTGVAIAKPVIRGLYGNRVLVLLSGLKFDNQQWQEEHGLGLSDMGLAKVELIKGPMSILYGTEAIGGIVNLVEETKPEVNMHEGDLSMKFNSNTMGGMLQGGYKVNAGNHWFRIRAGVENNADYSDGNNSRVLNSRFDGYDLKATYGFQKGNWISTNNYLSSFNRFGFIFNDIYDFVTPDARWSRKLNVNPCHLVLLNILSSENKLILKHDSKLDINFGVQSNERMENEGGGAISLNMHLLSAQYIVKWETHLGSKNRFILSNLGSFEDNTNFGARKIVPDANMQESNLSAYLETTLHEGFILENGLGIGEKYTKTFFTASVNGPEKEIHPFTKSSPYYNLYTGLTFFANKAFNVKANVATGVRVANLAELSSNGLHEGVFTYEIGDPKMKNEQSVSFNLFMNYTQQFVDISISPFYNKFFNYIYLAPTTEEWNGFPVFRYRQQDATQYGTEVTLTMKPTEHLQGSVSYSGMISKTADGNYTPYTPAQKLTPGVDYTIKTENHDPVTLYANVDHVFAQNDTIAHEKAAPDYILLNAGASTSFHSKGKTFNLSLAGNNLLNAAYYDHMSRFKNYGLLNMGRNIALKITMKFDPKPNHSR